MATTYIQAIINGQKRWIPMPEQTALTSEQIAAIAAQVGSIEEIR